MSLCAHAPPSSRDRCLEAGVMRLLVTSTARDGSLAGPDLDLLEEVLPCGLPVIAAGGISSLGDLVAVRDAGCEAAVAGARCFPAGSRSPKRPRLRYGRE